MNYSVTIVTAEKWLPSNIEPGSFVLVTDNWDDFNYRTTFVLHYVMATEVLTIGMVKISKRGTIEGAPHTKLPKIFHTLSDDFFSLGQDRDYYEKLMRLPNELGDKVLRALNDIAINEDAFDLLKGEKVLYASLLRDIPQYTVTTQFRRIAYGGAPLTPYSFKYRDNAKNNANNLTLDFAVTPYVVPSTNIHVIIGANGVGKSTILRNFAESAAGNSTNGIFTDETTEGDGLDNNLPFVNIVNVSYSAFDYDKNSSDHLSAIRIHKVGLGAGEGKHELREQFLSSLLVSVKNLRHKRWLSAIKTLSESDPILKEIALEKIISSTPSPDINIREAGDAFDGMSSGHKIVVLTITRLVELVEEKSLVLLDEPETHLHPPLLSAMVRSISDLVIDRNGVAIIATHSPVVLQEVPSSCVWMLRRSGDDVRASRLESESFGESVSRLTSEVFHLDIRKSGYHNVLRTLMLENGKSVDAVLRELDNQIGSEGIFSLYSFEEAKEDV